MKRRKAKRAMMKRVAEQEAALARREEERKRAEAEAASQRRPALRVATGDDEEEDTSPSVPARGSKEYRKRLRKTGSSATGRGGGGHGAAASRTVAKCRVTVIEARDLPSMDLIGKSDPYCKVEMGDSISFTSVKRGAGATPVWRERVTFEISEQHCRAGRQEVCISVYDEDWMKDSDDYYGAFRVNLAKLVRIAMDRGKRARLRKWFPFMTTSDVEAAVHLMFEVEPLVLPPHAAAAGGSAARTASTAGAAAAGASGSDIDTHVASLRDELHRRIDERHSAAGGSYGGAKAADGLKRFRRSALATLAAIRMEHTAAHVRAHPFSTGSSRRDGDDGKMDDASGAVRARGGRARRAAPALERAAEYRSDEDEAGEEGDDYARSADASGRRRSRAGSRDEARKSARERAMERRRRRRRRRYDDEDDSDGDEAHAAAASTRAGRRAGMRRGEDSLGRGDARRRARRTRRTAPRTRAEGEFDF
eukprot:PLAT11211.1.p1 GENE.PLAT11211.1~~PLAT11211.1.p1  ORF type:complete len:479 (+),score=188.43 PLAT11211.1:223-1659(+)